MKSARTTLEDYIRKYPEINSELKMTILLTLDKELYTHVEPMPIMPFETIAIEVRPYGRKNVVVKDSGWVKERRFLEEKMAPDCNEVILQEPDGSLFEGLSSNFFVICDGAVYTDTEHSLVGTMQQLAIYICKHEGILMRTMPPNIKDVNLWSAAFITSTSRILLPVREIRVPNDERSTKVFDEFSLLAKLRRLMETEIKEQSTLIIE